MDIGVNLDVLKKSGAWFYYGDMRLGQGRENVKTYLQQNPELMAEIEEKIRVKMKENANSKTGSDDKKGTPVSAKPVMKAPATQAQAKARLDITVDD